MTEGEFHGSGLVRYGERDEEVFRYWKMPPV